MGTISTSIASALSQIYYGTGSSLPDQVEQALAWRPPQWSKANGAVSAAGLAGSELGGTIAGSVSAAAAQLASSLLLGDLSFSLLATDSAGNQTVYVFDGVPHLEHMQQAVTTMNPVQNGAPISDHMYVVPPRLIAEIAMSDSMQSFFLGQFNDGAPRSVSAYQTLLSIQEQRLPVSISTRLKVYDSMVITSIVAQDSKDTKFALKATVVFQQILTASILTSPSSSATNSSNSAVPQATGQTLTGEVQALPVPDSITSQHYVSDDSSVPAAGNWSSTVVSG